MGRSLGREDEPAHSQVRVPWDSRPYYTVSDSRLLTQKSKSKSKSHCDCGQWINKSWCRAPSAAHDQIFINLWPLRSCSSGAPSLTRRRVRLLYMLLALPSVVFPDQSPLGLVTIFQCLRFETFLFVSSYDSQGHGEDIRTRLHTAVTQKSFLVRFINSWHGPHRKHSSCIVASIRLRGNAFTQLSHSNGSTRHISYRDNSSHYCVLALPWDGCFSASTVLALSKYATI
jgi:hypothetical protein